jgi:hypothetical protein
MTTLTSLGIVIALSAVIFVVYLYVITILRERKHLYCWYCLTDVEYIPNPHLIKDMEDLLRRPEMERAMAMTSHGLNPREVSTVNARVRLREAGVHKLNPWAYIPSALNMLHDSLVVWKREGNQAVPFCPRCDLPLDKRQHYWRRRHFLMLGKYLVAWITMLALWVLLIYLQWGYI